MKIKPKFILISISLFGITALGISSVTAIDVSETVFRLSPSSGAFNGNFSVDLLIDASVGITSAKAYLNFNPSSVRVASLDFTNSVFGYQWQKAFDNTLGKIQIQASTPSPGFAGSSGRIAKINFQVVSSGSVSITYNSNSLALGPTDQNVLNLGRSIGGSLTVNLSQPSTPTGGGDSDEAGGGGGGGGGGTGIGTGDSGDDTATADVSGVQAQINALLAQIASLRAQIAAILAANQASGQYKFTKSLYLGLNNVDVGQLQIFLKNQGTDIYPEGMVTNYFGYYTRQAVIRLQLKYGIIKSATSPGAGLVGIKTRAKVNELLGETLLP